MALFSVWSSLAYLISICLPAALFYRVLPKAGFPRWWAFLGVIPIVNIILLWVFAFSKWPELPERN